MRELVATRGLPGSGKTYYARQWIAEDSEGRARVNRDELRSNLFPSGGPVLPFQQENLISKVQQHAVTTLLGAGRSVIVDDTHLRAKYLHVWRDLAAKWGVEFRVEDFTSVPLKTCIARDEKRASEGGRHVGEVVIREMAMRLRSMPPLDLTPKEVVTPASEWKYEPNPELPRAWIFDVDGTLAHHVNRSPYEWQRVGEDAVDEPVRRILDLKRAYGDEILIVSGRDGECRPQTEEWLTRHEIFYRELFMRPAGDQRNDAIVKLEILRNDIAPKYNVLGVYDDRDRVVQAWRSVGLLCCQVAPGSF